MADNELYWKLILDDKDFNKSVDRAVLKVKGLGNVNIGASKNVMSQIAAGASEAEKNVGRLSKLWTILGENDMPSLRYALYDVSNNLRNIAAISTALAVTPLGFSIKYEREFANVIRTNQLVNDSTDDTTKAIRDNLLQIAQTTPISWEDVTNIATLAGQLGIAQGYITEFTETVAKFAATTDLTVEGAATAFGRLDQLIAGVDGNFQGLGSAILAVGVDSVATESQIVNVSTQIASMANLAKITAPEIIGLSGALASLGIRPELARGTVTRLFSNIGKSAAEGGFNVAEFGRLTGRTAEQFVADWDTKPGAVLQDFFDGINKEGPEAERTLRQLGITSVRDIPAILRLAQNSDEVRRLIGLSSEEYLRAGIVSEQYGVISQTTGEQLKRLTQNFATLQATIGDSVGPLSGFVQFLNNVVQGLNNLAGTGLGQALSGVAIAFSLLVAGVASLGSVLVGAIAGSIALRFAVDQLNKTGAFNIATNRGMTATLVEVGRAALGTSLSMRTMAGSTYIANGAMATLGATLRIMPIIGAVLVGISLLTAALGAWGDESSKAQKNVDKFFGGLDGLRSALEADADAFDEATGRMQDGSEAIATYTTKAEDNSDGLLDAAKAAEEFADSQKLVEDSVNAASDALDGQTLVAADKTLEYLQSQLLNQEDIVRAFGDPTFQQAFVDAGVEINDLLVAGIQGQDTSEILRPIAEDLKRQANELRNEVRKPYSMGGTGFTEFLLDPKVREAYQAQLDEIARLDALYDVVTESITDFTETEKTAIDGAVELNKGLSALEEGFTGTTVKANLAEDAIRGILDSLYAESDYIRDVEDSLNGLADAMAENVDLSESTQAAIESILQAPDQDVDVILGNLFGLLTLLQAQGPQTAASQEMVRAAMEAVGVQANIATGEVLTYASGLNAVANFDAANFQEILSAAMDKVANSAGGASSKVKTLADQFKELTKSIFDPVKNAQDAAQTIIDLGESYSELGDGAFYASGEIRDAVDSITASASTPEEAISNLNLLFNKLSSTVGSSTAPSLQFLRSVIDRLAGEFGIASDAIQQATMDMSFFDDGVQSVQKEVRTLLDYAGDLSSVISRAFSIRFDTIRNIDNIADSWDKLRQNIEDAKTEIESLQQAQSDLAADRAIKSYFLSVAESYGDMLRAAQLRKELADLDRQQAENATQLQTAQATAGGDLTGTGEGARQNRSDLIDLVAQYQTYITTLAESGASQDELRAATNKARQEFIQQALELGYQEEVVLQYAQAFDDVTTAIDNVPRNITVDANVNPALQALNELNAKLIDNINSAVRLNRVLADTKQLDPKLPPKTVVEIVPAKSTYSTTTPSRAEYEFRKAMANIGKFDSGGYTGAGGKYQPAGIVHKGEYVVPSQYVNQSSGLPNANFLAQLQNGMRGYANGGFVGGGGDGTMMVELSPYDRKLLADAGNVQLRLNGRVVAEATNASNYNEARRGSN